MLSWEHGYVGHIAEVEGGLYHVLPLDWGKAWRTVFVPQALRSSPLRTEADAAALRAGIICVAERLDTIQAGKAAAEEHRRRVVASA
jgi:hypothetical protein